MVLPRGPDRRCDFDAVCFAYPGGPTVLHDVDLADRAGAAIAVVGETGSGKTTFAKLLTRLMDPTAGRGAARRRRPARHPVRTRCASGSSWCRRTASCSTRRCAENIRLRPARRPPTSEIAAARCTELGLARLARRACRDGLRHRVGPARRVAVGRGAAAGRAGPGLPGRPRPAGARRGHLRRRPGDRGAPRSARWTGSRGAVPRSRSRTASPRPRPPTR